MYQKSADKHICINMFKAGGDIMSFGLSKDSRPS
jgi:hypothetical protein